MTRFEYCVAVKNLLPGQRLNPGELAKICSMWSYKKTTEDAAAILTAERGKRAKQYAR